MKVLQLCNKPPYPPVDGGTMAMNSVTEGLLAHGCEVRVLTVETDKHPLRRELIPDEHLRRTRLEAVHVDLGIHVLDAAAAWLCGESYHVKRYESADFAQKLREVLDAEEFDIIHMESIFLDPYVPLIRKHSGAKLILRAHNVEHQIWQRVARSTKNPFRRSYLKHAALTLRAYELEHVNDFDGVVCITRDDADYFRANGCRRPITAIPFGMEPADQPAVDVEPFSLFHIGSMDWLPNQEGIDWLLREVWPLVHREVPQAHLYLAGRKMPQRLMEAKVEGVTVVGEVADAMYFIASKQVNIVPLLSGSGIRVKIIEAMSAGKAVVSTTVGAQGIDYADGRNILLADTPRQFADQIKRLANDQDFCRQLGNNAMQLVAEQYDVRRLTDRLITFYEQRLAT